MVHASRILALAAVTLLVAACGGGSLPPAANATPAQSAASTTPPLAAGSHATAAFTPALTFTVPDGWSLVEDSSLYAQLAPIGSDGVGIHVFRDAAAASQDATCPTSTEPGVGSTSSELVAWLRSLPGLIVSTPALVTVGGLSGSSVDIGIAQGWSQSCPFANGIPTVALITFGSTGRWVMSGDERLRMYILDVPGGGTVIVDIDDFYGDAIDTFIPTAAPIIRTFVFATS